MAKKTSYQKKLQKVSDSLYKDYVALVDDKGYKNELKTFGLCSEYGLSLADSTIDKIEVWNDNILFYYNEEANDYDDYQHFEIGDLAQFFDELVRAIEEDEEPWDDVIDEDEIDKEIDKVDDNYLEKEESEK